MKKSLPFFLLTILFLFSFTSCSFGQKGKKNRTKAKFVHIKEAYDNALQAYTGIDEKGKVIRASIITQKRAEVKQLTADSLRFKRVVHDFPIVEHLFEHMLAGSKEQPDTLRACCTLLMAVDEYDRLCDKDRVTPARKAAIIADYEFLFGLTVPEDIYSMYRSQFSRAYGIKRSQPCSQPAPPVKKVDPLLAQQTNYVQKTDSSSVFKQPGKEKPLPLVKKGPSGMIYKIFPDDSTVVIHPSGEVIGFGSTTLEAIQMAMDSRKFKTPYLESTPLRLGRMDFIPTDQHGTFYEILLKQSITGDTLFFPPGRYSIPFDRSTNQWLHYNESMNEFAMLIYDYVCEFEGAFEFVLIGSADAAPMKSAMALKPPYNTEEFRKIKLTNYEYKNNGIWYFEDTINVGDFFNNLELCDLRPVFIKKSLENEPGFTKCPPKIRIIKGHVTSNFDPMDRNVTILLYINWDVVLRKLNPGELDKNYSPFNAKP